MNTKISLSRNVCYTLLLYSTCSILLLREDAQPKEWICWFHKKEKAGKEYHGPLRKFDEAIARFVGGNLNCWAYTRNWMCSLSQHSNQLSNRNTPRRFYHLLDWVGAYVPNYRHGTRWCNKCATIAGTFSSDKQDYIFPAKEYKYNVSLVYILFQFKNT